MSDDDAVLNDDDRGGEEYQAIMKEQDRFLPTANINRIMKKALPDNAKVAKDAKETVQECVSEFICFITSEASDRCQQEKRKTVNGEDILWAMQSLGFDNYCEPLKIYLNKYREVCCLLVSSAFATLSPPFVCPRGEVWGGPRREETVMKLFFLFSFFFFSIVGQD